MPGSSYDPGGAAHAHPVDAKKAGRLFNQVSTRIARWVDPEHDVKEDDQDRPDAQGGVVSEAGSGFGCPLDFLVVTPHAGDVVVIHDCLTRCDEPILQRMRRLVGSEATLHEAAHDRKTHTSDR